MVGVGGGGRGGGEGVGEAEGVEGRGQLLFGVLICFGDEDLADPYICKSESHSPTHPVIHV